jgi:flavodoxin I
MKKVIIVYGSTTGTTERMAGLVEREMKFSGLDVTVERASDITPEELGNYEVLVLGCSTWGDGELQEDFIEFEEKMRTTDLKGKKTAVFGPGESMYPQFCKAVDILEGTLKQCGAHLIKDGIKIDVSEKDCESAVCSWAKSVIADLV